MSLTESFEVALRAGELPGLCFSIEIAVELRTDEDQVLEALCKTVLARCSHVRNRADERSRHSESAPVGNDSLMDLALLHTGLRLYCALLVPAIHEIVDEAVRFLWGDAKGFGDTLDVRPVLGEGFEEGHRRTPRPLVAYAPGTLVR